MTSTADATHSSTVKTMKEPVGLFGHTRERFVKQRTRSATGSHINRYFVPKGKLMPYREMAAMFHQASPPWVIDIKPLG